MKTKTKLKTIIKTSGFSTLRPEKILGGHMLKENITLIFILLFIRKKK